VAEGRLPKIAISSKAGAVTIPTRARRRGWEGTGTVVKGPREDREETSRNRQPSTQENAFSTQGKGDQPAGGRKKMVSLSAWPQRK